MKTAVSYRFSEESQNLLEGMAKAGHTSQTAILEGLIFREAERQKDNLLAREDVWEVLCEYVSHESDGMEATERKDMIGWGREEGDALAYAMKEEKAEAKSAAAFARLVKLIETYR